jgi:tetratricopeptide (TPR) repeat protein
MSTTDSNRPQDRPECTPDATMAGPDPRPARWRGRTLLTAIGAISAIGIAGFVIHGYLPGIIGEGVIPGTGPKPQPQATAAAASDRGMISSRLEVLRVGGGDTARTVIALAKPTGPSRFAEILGTDQGIIARELVRQAILMAARDELGLATRDEVLDDQPPIKSGEAVAISSVFRTDGPSRMLVRRGEGADAKILLEHAMGPVPDDVGILAKILPVAEELSRTSFPATLKGLGAAGARNKIVADAPLPPQVAERLEGLGFIDHFAAIRDLHAAIRSGGESPERLGAMARAYAQLGLLTEFHWHPAHKVYKARALLYAQRLLAREPASAWALWNRAFVKSVLGLHQEALDDLAEASKHLGAGRDAARPAWIAPAEAYAKNELARLGEMDGPHAKLARLLRMLAVEYPLGTSYSLRTAGEVVAADIECYRAHDAMCRVGGVANLHRATLAGAEVFTRLLPVSIGALAGLPTGVEGAITGRVDELALTEALDKAGSAGEDAGEPSWGCLGHLIRETRFTQVARRLIFMKVIWGVPVDDYWPQVRPLVARHRYRTFLESYALPPQQIRPAFVEFSNQIDLTDLEHQAPELFAATEQYQTTRGEKHDGGFAYGHGDALARDLAACTQTQDASYKAAQAKVLLAVSPHSAVARGILIVDAWDQVKDQADTWEKEAEDSPFLLESLGWRRRELKQYDRAQRLLRRCVELSPQRSVYDNLAATFREQGDMEGWRRTLDEYLARGEDHGLDHAEVRVQIARHYMDQKRWEDAAPYAEAAAETWAGWAMVCAVECYEAMGEWEKGEAWVRRLTERYPNTNWAAWYCYCRRTGHGEVEAARAWTDAYLESARGRPDLADPTGVAYYSWLSGSMQRAQAAFDALFAEAPSAGTGIPLALVADEAGDSGRRDAVMKQLCTTMKDQAPKTLAIFQLMSDALATDKPLDLAAVDAILNTLPPETRTNGDFCVGKFLLNHGRAEIGREYLRRAAESPMTHDWWRQLAVSIVGAKETEKKP